jgi:hypothetical protein
VIPSSLPALSSSPSVVPSPRLTILRGHVLSATTGAGPGAGGGAGADSKNGQSMSWAQVVHAKKVASRVARLGASLVAGKDTQVVIHVLVGTSHCSSKSAKKMVRWRAGGSCPLSCPLSCIRCHVRCVMSVVLCPGGEGATCEMGRGR